jgi:mono/diheme cytochrome c family protein
MALGGCGEPTSVPAPNPEPDPEPPVRPSTEARDRLLREHHDQCVDIFGKTMGTGFERMRVLRHSPSNFPTSVMLPGQPNPNGIGGQPEPWMMLKSELVGLMDDNKPGAYPIPQNIPGGIALRPLKRELDAFEAAALARLRAGEELVVEPTAEGKLRALGAIRLTKACLGCHQGTEGAGHPQPRRELSEGHLMGAFSYVFTPGVAPMPQPPSPIKP